MKALIHRIQTEDGLELHGILYRLEKETKTVLAQVHGMTGNFYENKFLDNLAKTLTKNNIAFCPFNNRGSGNITTFVKEINGKREYLRIGNANEKFEDCLLDIKAHIDFLENQGFTNIHLSGHSLGAPKVTYYLGKSQDKRIKSLILLSPADMLGLARENKERFEEEIAEAKKMIAEGRGDKLMPKKVWDEYPLTASTYLSLFDNNSEAGVLNFHNPNDQFKILSQITRPIFTIMGRKDDVLIIPIENIMSLIKEKAKSSLRCEHQILGEADHNYQGYEQELADTILKWVKNYEKGKEINL